uniref:PH_RBD domain-containing protein n=1 Tax=Macrostomum lignano TaxID=282301 RepID=A0A1I8F8J1_9PLAT
MSCAFKERSTEELLQRHLRASPMRSPGSPKTNRAPSLRVLRHLYSSRLAGISLQRRHRLRWPALSESSNSAAAAAITASAADNLLLLHQVGRAALLYGQKWRRVAGWSCSEVDAELRHAWRRQRAAPHLPARPSVAEGASPLSADAGIDDSISSPSDVESSLLSNRSRCDKTAGFCRWSGNWEAAFLIRVEEMVYIHCHGDGGGGSLVFVARDGTQQPPLHFPPGGSSGSSCDNLLQFLTSLETGLATQRLAGPAALDPVRSSGVALTDNRRAVERACLGGLSVRRLLEARRPPTVATRTGDDAADYVFRIVLRGGGFSFESAADFELGTTAGLAAREPDATLAPRATKSPAPQPEQRQASIQQLCQQHAQADSVQSLQRLAQPNAPRQDGAAVPGGLLDGRLGVGRADDFPAGLTAGDLGASCPGGDLPRHLLGRLPAGDEEEGVAPDARFHPWDSTETERRSLDQAAQARFENLLSEWGPVDVIVRENDKEQVINARDILRKKLEAVEAAAAASAKSKVKKQQQNLRPQNRRLPDPPPRHRRPSSYEESPVAVSAVTDDPENQLGADA